MYDQILAYIKCTHFTVICWWNHRDNSRWRWQDAALRVLVCFRGLFTWSHSKISICGFFLSILCTYSFIINVIKYYACIFALFLYWKGNTFWLLKSRSFQSLVFSFLCYPYNFIWFSDDFNFIFYSFNRKIIQILHSRFYFILKNGNSIHIINKHNKLVYSKFTHIY